MPPETVVIACPACKNVARVPVDWLGQTVQCPECKATFTAPVREGDRLTDPVLLAGPPGGPAAPTPRRADPLLWLPAFGLMFVGIASLIANGVLLARFVASPDGGKEWLRNQMPAIRQMGFKPEAGEEDPAAADEQAAAELAPKLVFVWPVAMIAGAVTAAGGVAMVRRKGYRLAQVGCVLASLNVPHLCCIPGAIFGLWGLLMLMSDEGREHFRLRGGE